MLDPRIYRAALVPVLLALIVLRASRSSDRPRPIGDDAGARRRSRRRARMRATLDGARRRASPPPRPATRGDERLARDGRATASARSATASRSARARFDGETIDGERAPDHGRSRARPAQPGRRASSSSPTATRSGAARGPSCRAPRRCSSSRASSRGAPAAAHADASSRRAAAAAARRARATSADAPGAGRVDAVLVLGDLAGARPCAAARRPLVERRGARRRCAAAHGRGRGARRGRHERRRRRARRRSGRASRFPVTVGEQGPLVAAGLPAVAAVGERRARAAAPARRSSRGAPAGLRPRGAAHDHRARRRPRRSTAGAERGIVDAARKVLPAWAVRLLVARAAAAAALVARRRLRARAPAPRARRPVAALVGRGRRPFLAAALFAWLLGLDRPARRRAAGSPCPPARCRSTARARIALVAVGLVFVLGWIAARARAAAPRWAAPVAPAGRRAARRRAAVVLVRVVGRGRVWVVNPYAAALLVPAAHLWLALRSRPSVRLRARAGARARRWSPRCPSRSSPSSVAGAARASARREALWFCLLLVAGGHVAPVGCGCCGASSPRASCWPRAAGAGAARPRREPSGPSTRPTAARPAHLRRARARWAAPSPRCGDEAARSAPRSCVGRRCCAVLTADARRSCCRRWHGAARAGDGAAGQAQPGRPRRDLGG